MRFEEFFEIYFKTIGNDEYGGIEIRALKKFENKNAVRSLYIERDHILVPENSKELAEIINQILYLNRKKRWNVYFSANPRKPPFECKKTKYGIKCKAGDKRKVVNNVRILMLDFDVLHGENIADVQKFENWLRSRTNKDALFNAISQMAFTMRQILEKYGIVPTIMTYSGYGFQMIFALRDPIPKEEYDYYAAALLEKVKEILASEPVEFDPIYAQIPQGIAKKSKILPDEQVKDVARILRLPNTYNWRYSVPVMANIIYPSSVDDYKVVYMDNEVLSELAEEIKTKSEFSEIKRSGENNFSNDSAIHFTDYSWTASVKMGETAKKALYEFLNKYYVEGQRHNIVLRIAGMARAFGYAPEDVLEIVERIYKESGDTDNFSDRYRAVVDTYSKPPSAIGWYPLPAIEENLRKKYPTTKSGKPSKRFLNAIKEAERDIKKLMRAFYEDIEKAEAEGRIDTLVKMTDDGKFVIE